MAEASHGFMVFIAAAPVILILVLGIMVIRKKARRRANLSKR